MVKYRQPQLPFGNILFMPKGIKRQKKVIRKGGETFATGRKKPAPLGMTQLANRVATTKLFRARRKMG